MCSRAPARSAIAVLFSSSVAPVGAADPASNAAASAAVAWLKTQQQPDGGFEVAQFAGFETRDVVLAIAEQAQTGTTWSSAQALAAVRALKAGGSGPTPLDYLEGLMAASTTDPGVAAKTVVLVTEPLGIDATAFGSVNLLTKMGGCDGTASTTFNGLLYLAIAQQLLCGAAPGGDHHDDPGRPTGERRVGLCRRQQHRRRRQRHDRRRARGPDRERRDDQ